MDDRLDLEVNFPIGLPELRRESGEAKKEISGVGETADHVSKKVLDRIKEYERLQDKMANAKGWAAQVNAIREANVAIAELHGRSLEDIFGKIMDPPDAEKLHTALAGVTNEFDQIDLIVDTLRDKLATIEPIDLADKDEVAAEIEAIAAYNNQMRAIVEEAPKLTTQLSSIKNAMADLAAQNKENTEEYRMLRDMAGQLEEAIKQTNDAVKQAASPSAGLDQLIRATSLLVAGFNIAQGAAALFGEENEEIQRSILRVTAAMSILQGLQQIQIELKRKDTVVTMAQTAAQRAYAIAVGQSVGAMRLLRLALVGLGIGAVVVGIILLIQRYREMRKEAEAAARVQKELNDAMGSVPTAVGKARRELDDMAAKLRLAKEGVISKTGVLKEYNDGLGKTFGAAKSLNEAEQAIVKNGDAFIAVTMAKAKAMAVAELAAEKYSEMIKAQLKTDEEYVDYSMSGLANSSDPKVQAMYRKNAEKNRQIAVDEKRKEYEAIERLQTMYEYDLAQKAKQTGLTPFTYTDPKDPAGKKVLDDRVRLLNEIAKAEREVHLDRLDQNTREIEEIRYKYQVMRDEAKRLGLGEDVTGRIDAVEGNEVSAALTRQDEAEAAKLKAAAKARMDALLKEYATYEQKRQKIIADSEKDIADLLKAGETERAKQVEKMTAQQLMELDKAYIEGSEAFKDLNKTLATAGSAMALEALNNGRKVITSFIKGMKGKTDAEKAGLIKMFNEWFDTTIAQVETENFGNVTDLVDGFGQLVESAFKFDGAMGSSLKTVSAMVTQVGKLSQTLSQTLGKAGDSLSKGGGYAAIVGAVLSVASAISEGFNAARQRRNEEAQAQFDYQNDRQLRATEAITRALETQLELINEIYGADRLTKYAESLEGIKSNWEDINKQLDGRLMMTNDQFTNSILARLNNGESAKAILKSFSVASNEYYRVGNILDNLGRFDRLSSLPSDISKARDELAKLQYQAALGSVDDYTQKLIDQLAAQIELYDETMNRLREESTGTSFESLLSDTSNLFFNAGGDAGDAWNEGFDKVIENYLVQKFSRDYLSEKMQAWYETFAEFAEDGLSKQEKDLLRAERDKIWAEGNKVLDDLRDTLGVDKPSGSGSQSGISGRINRTIEESTASEILGFERARYDLHKRSLGNAEETLRVEKQLYDATLQSLRHQAAIEQNTADTVVELRSAVVELKAINKNTKQSSTSYDRP